MARSSKLKEEILTVIEELGGEVIDTDGFAARRVFERVASTGTYTAVSTALGELDKAGAIVRDMPNMKRTTRIALADRGFAPARKSLSVVSQELASSIAGEMETMVERVIEAEVQGRVAEYECERCEAAERDAELARQEAKALRSENATLRANNVNTSLKAQVDQLKAELADERERIRTLERSVESWKQNAMGRPVVREMLAEVKDQLDPKTRAELEKLMRELPSGGR